MVRYTMLVALAWLMVLLPRLGRLGNSDWLERTEPAQSESRPRLSPSHVPGRLSPSHVSGSVRVTFQPVTVNQAECTATALAALVMIR
jgi:hypothetical protein